MKQKTEMTNLARSRAGKLFQGLSVLWLMVLASCASGPTESGTTVPAWVLNPPQTEGQDYVFVAAGTHPTDQAQAEVIAEEALSRQIMNYLGVQVTSETSAEARGTLDEFQANITSVLTARSEARVSGFRLDERYMARQGGQVNVYLKGLYNIQELDREKARLQALFQEQIDAIAVPEREGDRFVAAGQLFQAIGRYLEAAAAAYQSEIQNAEIQFERNMNKARQALQGMSIVSLTPRLETPMGQSFSQDFQVKVVRGTQETDPGIADVPLRVSYRVRRPNGSIGVSGSVIRTDSQGIARFTHPAPNFVGSQEVTYLFDLGASITILDDVPRSQRQQVNSFEEAAARNRGTANAISVSNAPNIPMGVLILDRDNGNNNRPTSETASGLLQTLTQAGFRVTLINANAAGLAQSDPQSFLNSIRSALPAGVERVVLGSIRIDELSTLAGRPAARATGSVTVLDVATGQILFNQTKNRRGSGGDNSAAISTAFRQIGQDFGSAMVNELP